MLKRLAPTDIKLEFGFISTDDEENYVIINSDKFGIVQDIDLSKLEEFARFLDSEALTNGYSFIETESRDISASGDTEPRASQPKKLIKDSQRRIYKLYHDSITEESRAILGFHKRLVPDSRKRDKLVRLGKSAFVVKAGDNFAEEIRHDISGIKDQFSEAIDNEALGKIEELTALYISIAEGFLELLRDYGASYTFEQAVQERQTPFAGWKQVNWLSSDVRYLIQRALQSHNYEIIMELVHIPIAISRRAIEKMDHYLFQEFIWFPELLYLSSQQESDPKLKRFLVDRSWRYIKEVADYYLESKLTKESLTPGELESFKNFAVYILTRIQALMKNAFDADDLESFNTFKKVADMLFRRFTNERGVQDSGFIELQLKNQDLTSQQSDELRRLLEKRVFRENIQKEIIERKSQMFFGLASWILYKLSSDKGNESLKAFFGSIKEVCGYTLESLTEAFLGAHTFEAQDFWNWDRWESIPDGEVHSINVFGKLEKFYAVRALSLVANKQDEDIGKIKLPHNRDLASLSAGARDLVRILTDIKQNPDQWAYVLDVEAIRKVDSFISLLAVAKQNQEEEEKEQIRNTPISSQKVHEFKKNVFREFYRTAYVRSIFNHWGSVKNDPQERADGQFGISTLDDKASFFDKWFAYYLDWGNNYGLGMANGEDASLLNELAALCETIENQPFEKLIEDHSNKKDLIILMVNGSFLLASGRSEKFTPDWTQGARNLDVNGFAGWYKSNNKLIPVFEIFGKHVASHMLILEQGQIGQMIQFLPVGSKSKPESVFDIFSIDVQSFSENRTLMEKFLVNPPGWLLEVVPKEGRENYLKERVLVEVFESFRYERPVNKFGYKIILGNKLQK